MPLTEAQKNHIRHLRAEFGVHLTRKYKAGAEEHKGDLRDLTGVQLLDAALDEVVDQWVYIKTLRDRLAENM